MQSKTLAPASGATQVTSYAVTLDSNATAGNFLVVALFRWAVTTSETATMADNHSNTYTRAASPAIDTSGGDNVAIDLFTAPVTTGGAMTITATLGTARAGALIAFEISGGGIGQISMATAVPSTSTDEITSGAVTTTQPQEMICGFACNAHSGASFTPGTGFTSREAAPWPQSGCWVGGETMLQTSPGSIAGTWTSPTYGGQDYVAGVVTVLPVGGGGPGGGGGGGGGFLPFGTASAINKRIPANTPYHPDDAAMITGNPNFVLPSSSSYREWLGPRGRCYWLDVPDLTALSTVSVYRNYDDVTGYGCAGSPLTEPMTATVQAALAKDDNSIESYDRCIYFRDNAGHVYEGYRVTPPGFRTMDISCDTSHWNAVRWDSLGNAENNYVGYGHGYGASGSGILIGCGTLRPGDFTDLSANSVIPHALRFIAEFVPDGSLGSHPPYVPPATGAGNNGTAGFSQTSAIPTGARLQLDPTINVDTWPSVVTKAEPWQSALKKILRTCQQYGMIYVDGTGTQGAGGFEACTRDTVTPYQYPWETAGYGWAYSNGVPYDLMSRFHVINWNVWTGV